MALSNQTFNLHNRYFLGKDRNIVFKIIIINTGFVKVDIMVLYIAIHIHKIINVLTKIKLRGRYTVFDQQMYYIRHIRHMPHKKLKNIIKR